MTTSSSQSPPAQPLVLIASPDSSLRIQLARMVARTSARALVVLNIDATVPLLLSRDVVLAIVDEREAAVHSLGIAQALQRRSPDVPIVLLREQNPGAVQLVNGSIVVHSISDRDALQALITDLAGGHMYASVATPR